MPFTFLNSRVLLDRSLPNVYTMYPDHRRCRSAILRSVSDRATNNKIKVNRSISPIVTLKLVAITTSLERKEKVRFLIYDQIPTIR